MLGARLWGYFGEGTIQSATISFCWSCISPTLHYLENSFKSPLWYHLHYETLPELHYQIDSLRTLLGLYTILCSCVQHLLPQQSGPLDHDLLNDRAGPVSSASRARFTSQLLFSMKTFCLFFFFSFLCSCFWIKIAFFIPVGLGPPSDHLTCLEPNHQFAWTPSPWT